MDNSLASIQFEIVFHSFNVVCELLRIKEEDDYERMVYKEFQSPSNYATMLVGCLLQGDKEGLSFSQILIGFSGIVELRSASSSTDDVDQFRNCVCFEEENRPEYWDKSQQCFLSK